jgi:uncharacterized phage protein (TIGR01671 family)
MKTIKFRMWSKEAKKFFYDPENVYDCLKLSQSPLYAHLYKDLVWQQFTGLKDSKGVEIYEGDIVKRLNTEYVYEVVYNEENAAYFLQNKDSDGPLSYYRKVVEVAGNIFENSELLK